MFSYHDVEAAVKTQASVSPDMARALELWYALYRDRAPWKQPGTVKSLNLAAAAAGEIARQVTMEMKWNITGKPAAAEKGPGGAAPAKDNARAEYLKGEFGKLMEVLRQKLEVGCAAGGMIVKPWPDLENGGICFDFAMDWSVWPLAFDGAGNLTDVVIPDVYREGDAIYTRLERHRRTGDGVVVTQRAFKSNREEALGTEVPLEAVGPWAALPPEAVIEGTEGPLFGWFRVASANSVDVNSPMGASVYARAVEVLREIDMQYSRLLWEFEGGELAVDVDPTAFYEKRDGGGRVLPKLNERLFRAVDTGAESTYQVFAPALRDGSLVNGLNQLLIRFEDLVGLSRGTFSDVNMDARTATELKIVRQRGFATVADNQRALEKCLRDVLRAMDKYATIYGLAPEGEYEVAFDWDDSILTDAEAQLRQRLALVEAGAMSRAELRQWYLGETGDQARAGVEAAERERAGRGEKAEG